MQLKPIARNMNVINILLMGVVTLFALYSLSPLLEMKVTYALPAAKKVAGQKEETTVQTQTPSVTEYVKITDENLFHPERRIPPEKKEEKPLPKPEFVCYGTLISDDLSLAYLEDIKAPRSSPGRGKRVTPMKRGDSMSGFTLREIETDKVVMYRGEEQLIVPVNDPSRPRDRKESVSTKASSQQPQEKPPAVSPGLQKRKSPTGAVRDNKSIQKPRTYLPSH